VILVLVTQDVNKGSYHHKMEQTLIMASAADFDDGK